MRTKAVVIFFAGLMASLMITTACQKELAPYRAYANDADVPRIPVDEAKKDFDSGVAIIVDARDANSFAQEHVAGAINIPGGSLETEMSKLPSGKKIIVYCS